jgi:hypothetical protein
MKNDPTYHMLMEACRKPECPVCGVVQENVEKYISGFFYESILDPEARAHVRASLGLCREHAWLAQAAGLSDALGLAILYHDLVGTIAKAMPDFITAKPCPACEQERMVTERAVMVTARSLNDRKFMSALQGSQGLCLPHLKSVADQRPAGLQALLDLEHTKLVDLHAELGEFIRKNDYRFQHEGFGGERDSYQRAIGIVNGKNRHRIKEIGKHAGWGKGSGSSSGK